MCTTKKLCICDTVQEGADHWLLQFRSGWSPSWGKVADTRPEHRELAELVAKRSEGILGPLPKPLFHEIYSGLADPETMENVIHAEEEWLNSENRFDFPYTPVDWDRLMFVIGGEEIAFSYRNGKWGHHPHQEYSVDHRRGVNAEQEDKKARERARIYLRDKKGIPVKPSPESMWFSFGERSDEMQTVLCYLQTFLACGTVLYALALGQPIGVVLYWLFGIEGARAVFNFLLLATIGVFVFKNGPLFLEDLQAALISGTYKDTLKVWVKSPAFWSLAFLFLMMLLFFLKPLF